MNTSYSPAPLERSTFSLSQYWASATTRYSTSMPVRSMNCCKFWRMPTDIGTSVRKTVIFWPSNCRQLNSSWAVVGAAMKIVLRINTMATAIWIRFIVCSPPKVSICVRIGYCLA